jgi:hypothetical protein
MVRFIDQLVLALPGLDFQIKPKHSSSWFDVSFFPREEERSTKSHHSNITNSRFVYFPDRLSLEEILCRHEKQLLAASWWES